MKFLKLNFFLIFLLFTFVISLGQMFTPNQMLFPNYNPFNSNSFNMNNPTMENMLKYMQMINMFSQPGLINMQNFQQPTPNIYVTLTIK
jgi:hypothetical protein